MTKNVFSDELERFEEWWYQERMKKLVCMFSKWTNARLDLLPKVTRYRHRLSPTTYKESFIHLS